MFSGMIFLDLDFVKKCEKRGGGAVQQGWVILRHNMGEPPNYNSYAIFFSKPELQCFFVGREAGVAVVTRRGQFG